MLCRQLYDRIINLAVILFKRLVLHEEQRKLAREGPASQRHLIELQPPPASGKRDKQSESGDH
jgi:hypothetical protein